MAQNANQAQIARGPTNTPASLRVDARGALLISDLSATLTALNITAPTAVKVGAGFVARVMVLVAGTAAGTVNDAATTGAAAASNQIAVIPNTVGPVVLEFPYSVGLILTPGTGQTLAVAYV